MLDARRLPWLSPGVKKPGWRPHGDAPDVTSGARRYTAAMKWQRHEDGDIILAVVITCALAGLAWLARWWWRRILVRAFDRGYSLGFLRGCTQRLGRRTGWNLEDYGRLRDFLDMYEERVSKSQLPEIPELRRTAFRPEPEGTPRMHERLCERLRVAATAMGYVMGKWAMETPGGVEGRPLRPVREARQVRGRAEGRVGGQELVDDHH